MRLLHRVIRQMWGPRTLVGHLPNRDTLYVKPRVADFITRRRCIKGGVDILSRDAGPQVRALHRHNGVVSFHVCERLPNTA
jgi:hypothetical protein